MYNVPFHLSNFNPTQQASTTNNEGNPLTSSTSLDSPPNQLLQLQQQQQQQTNDFSSLTSPTPTHKTTHQATYDTSMKQPNETYYASTHDDWVTSPAETSSNSGAMDDEFQQQHMQHLFEKKRRRRESHNAVERRRRDNINERIFELSTLLPERDAIKNNKGTILRKSVEHIRLLHDQVNKCQHRIQELENMLGLVRVRGDLPPMMQSSFSQPTLHPQLAYRRDG